MGKNKCADCGRVFESFAAGLLHPCFSGDEYLWAVEWLGTIKYFGAYNLAHAIEKLEKKFEGTIEKPDIDDPGFFKKTVLWLYGTQVIEDSKWQTSQKLVIYKVKAEF